MDIDKAFATQLANIQTRSGKSLEELGGIVRKSGLSKHGEIRDMLKKDVGLGHGDANTLTHFLQKSSAAFEEPKGDTDVVDGIYTGSKAALRPIHDKVMAAIHELGEFEIAPKKSYLSLRRKKQFAMVGPGTKNRLEVGLNMKGVEGTERLEQLAPGGMCQYSVKLSDLGEVDAELIGWIRQAYQSAG